MLKGMVKELSLSVVAALVIGGIGFAFLNLTVLQAFILTLFFTIYFFLLLFLYTKYDSPEIKKHISQEPEEQFRLLEKKLKKVTAKAEKLEKENKTTELFLASMSHEIRTPLNGIVGLTELLDGTELTEEQKEFVSMIRESSHNLNVIVNDILDVSKINAGKMELENIPFDLFTKMEASVGMFVPKIEDKGIVLNLFTDPKIAHHVIGDPTRLSQVIINLVSNAVKFTERDGKIDLFAEYIDEKDDSVTFKVSVNDSGIGLTEEQQARIFEAYSQAEASTTRKAGGTGLGLTISSKIIKSMGSELKVESKEGEGSTFFFTLTLPKVAKEKEPLERYDDLKVGVICAEGNPKSQWNRILQKYIGYYGATYQNYAEKNIFASNCPDILLIEHDAIEPSTIESFEYLSCKRILLTSSKLHTDLGRERKVFDEIIYMPITFEKVGKLLQLQKGYRESDEKETVLETPVEFDEKKRFEDLHILVAEDNPINQKLIKVVLENFGLTVTMASNGEEAYQYRQQAQYDMIFMDIQMPVMGGVEATQLILDYEKERGVKHIPIIALTANALSGDKEKYMAEGMDDYATKPLDLKVIEKLIVKYCHL
jgi:signal transduction histidine kinase/CheY-like chemotaxis protein